MGPGQDSVGHEKSSGEARHLFRSLFTAYPDALLLVDAQGLIVLANPQATELLGYAEHEWVGLSVDALVPQAFRPRHAQYRQAYAHQPVARPMGTTMELVARRRDGTEVMVEIALSPLRDQGLPYVVAAVRGIDSYPRVQQALRRARYSDCLAQMARLAVDEPDPQVMLQRLPAAVAEVLQASTACVLLLQPGARDFVLAAGCALPEEEALGTLVANTPHTLAGYAALQVAQAAHTAPAGPAANTAAADTATAPAQNHATPRAIHVTVSNFANEQRFAVPAHFLRHGQRSGLAVPLAESGQVMGVLTLRCAANRQWQPDELQFVQSIASLLATRLQRARSEEAFQHAQRLDTVGQLTGGIAHDFNNLLTVIQGNLQLLEERPALQHDTLAAPALASALRATQRGAELTNKLLAFSRRQTLSPKVLDVGAMLQALADMLRRTLDRSIQVQVEVATDPAVYCTADPGQLESALLNLAVNARDAMPAGGVLRFVCRALPWVGGATGPLVAHDLAVEMATELAGDLANDLAGDLAGDPATGIAEGQRYAAIEVSDSGSGMAPEVCERAFEPFFTTKEVGRGTGLGLSTVYGFVKQSLGTVRLRSRPGAGTTVTLVLPCVDAAQAFADSAANSAVLAAWGGGPARLPPIADAPGARTLPAGLSVLLVEDQPEVRQTITQSLLALGCCVVDLASAEEALAYLATQATPAVLLTDVALGPGLRGTELARQVRQRWPQMARLLMSGYINEALADDDDDLLAKPFDRATLLAALLRVLPARPP